MVLSYVVIGQDEFENYYRFTVWTGCAGWGICGSGSTE